MLSDTLCQRLITYLHSQHCVLFTLFAQSYEVINVAFYSLSCRTLQWCTQLITVITVYYVNENKDFCLK